MIAYAPYQRAFLSQAPAPSEALLAQLLKAQEDIARIIANIPPGSVDQAKMATLRAKMDQCIALGPTTEALKCLTDLRASVVAASPVAAPVWPWIAGGVAAAGLAALLLFSK